MDNRVLENIMKAIEFKKENSLNALNSQNLKKSDLATKINRAITHIESLEKDNCISINHRWYDEHKEASVKKLSECLHQYASINNSIQRYKIDVLKNEQKIEAINKLIRKNLQEQLYQFQTKEDENVEELCIAKECSRL